MITANEARQYVEDAMELIRVQRQKTIAKKLQEIESEIRANAELAKTEIVIINKTKFFGQLEVEGAVVKELRQNGFVVDNSTVRVTISWALDKKNT